MMPWTLEWEQGQQVGQLLPDDDVRGDGHGYGLEQALAHFDQGVRAEHQFFDAAHYVENLAELRFQRLAGPEGADLQPDAQKGHGRDDDHERHHQDGHFLYGPGEQGVGHGFVDLEVDRFEEGPAVYFSELVVVEANHGAQDQQARQQGHDLGNLLPLGDVAILALFVAPFLGGFFRFTRIFLADHGNSYGMTEVPNLMTFSYMLFSPDR